LRAHENNEGTRSASRTEIHACFSSAACEEHSAICAVTIREQRSGIIPNRRFNEREWCACDDIHADACVLCIRVLCRQIDRHGRATTELQLSALRGRRWTIPAL